MARFVSRIKQRAVKAFEERAERKRAKERGRRGISDELAERMFRGLQKRTRDPEQFSDLWNKALRRTAVKNALQRSGITNTKKDPNKIARILALVDRGANRSLLLKQMGIERDRDPVIEDITQELAREVGGKLKLWRLAFTLTFKTGKDMERLYEKYSTEGQA